MGGINITEQSIDLSLALSLCSQCFNQVIPKSVCSFGEIGLAGEIRNVSNYDRRIHTADKLGFKKCFVPGNIGYVDKVTFFKVFRI